MSSGCAGCSASVCSIPSITICAARCRWVTGSGRHRARSVVIGRGLQQTLLVITYLQVNKGAVLLLDEPDAHLEFLRQRHIYQLLTDSARQHGSQIVAASHSEVLLNEAADRDVVVAFVGRPHRIGDRGTRQVRKWLKEIGFEAQVLAEQTGWVPYVEARRIWPFCAPSPSCSITRRKNFWRVLSCTMSSIKCRTPKVISTGCARPSPTSQVSRS